MYSSTHTVQVKKILNESEMTQYAKKQNSLLREAAQKLEELALHTKAKKGAISRIQSEADEFGRKVDSGYELLEIATYRRPNYRSGYYEFYNCTTGDLVQKESIPATEIQKYSRRQLNILEDEQVKVVRGMEAEAELFFRSKYNDLLLSGDLDSFLPGLDEEKYINEVYRNKWIVQFIDTAYSTGPDFEAVEFDVAYDTVAEFFDSFMNLLVKQAEQNGTPKASKPDEDKTENGSGIESESNVGTQSDIQKFEAGYRDNHEGIIGVRETVGETNQDSTDDAKGGGNTQPDEKERKEAPKRSHKKKPPVEPDKE